MDEARGETDEAAGEDGAWGEGGEVVCLEGAVEEEGGGGAGAGDAETEEVVGGDGCEGGGGVVEDVVGAAGEVGPLGGVAEGYGVGIVGGRGCGRGGRWGVHSRPGGCLVVEKF